MADECWADVADDLADGSQPAQVKLTSRAQTEVNRQTPKPGESDKEVMIRLKAARARLSLQINNQRLGRVVRGGRNFHPARAPPR